MTRNEYCGIVHATVQASVGRTVLRNMEVMLAVDAWTYANAQGWTDEIVADDARATAAVILRNR